MSWQDLVFIFFDHLDKFNEFSNELKNYLVGSEIHSISLRQLFNFLQISLSNAKRTSGAGKENCQVSSKSSSSSSNLVECSTSLTSSFNSPNLL